VLILENLVCNSTGFVQRNRCAPRHVVALISLVMQKIGSSVVSGHRSDRTRIYSRAGKHYVGIRRRSKEPTEEEP
jgi:hypothetical protein